MSKVRPRLLAIVGINGEGNVFFWSANFDGPDIKRVYFADEFVFIVAVDGVTLVGTMGKSISVLIGIDDANRAIQATPRSQRWYDNAVIWKTIHKHELSFSIGCFWLYGICWQLLHIATSSQCDNVVAVISFVVGKVIQVCKEHCWLDLVCDFVVSS
jgi:hypothetical protein